MTLNSKVEAYTIIEVTVSMLLAAISIAIAYTSYRVITSSYRQFDEKNKKVSEFILTDKLLKRDIAQSNRMLRTIDGFSLAMPEGEVQYHFTEGYILRTQYALRTDTLFLASNELKSSFEESEVFEGELMDQCSFSTRLENSIITLTYRKEYSAEELFYKAQIGNK